MDSWDDDLEEEVLAKELIQISQAEGFLASQPGGKFDSDGKNIRAREIGEELDGLGGMELMREVFYTIQPRIGSSNARQLEMVWGGIGDWQG